MCEPILGENVEVEMKPWQVSFLSRAKKSEARQIALNRNILAFVNQCGAKRQYNYVIEETTNNS